MTAHALRSWWAEPRPGDVPGLGPRDWALVAVLIGWSVVEAVARQDLAPAPLLVVAALAVVVPQLWRRSRPLIAVATSLGTLTAVDLVRNLTGEQGSLLNTGLAALVLVYALFRWGSGRATVSGLVLVLLWLAVITTFGPDPTSPAEVAAGYAFFLLAAVLGAAIRFRSRIRLRDLDQAKTREREQLARDLHDTVAHHISAIAIQAQAGQAVAATHPERALEALAVIEDAASRTLIELRAVVGVLRDGQDIEFAPQPGLAEIEHLATAAPTRPGVAVTVSGEFDDLNPVIGTAIYRLAQEAVTNARRHARHATRITVAVTGDAERIRLTVHDDGAPGTGTRSPAGYGLVGMRERATLLGGTFQAGPAVEPGWTVEAVLPRTGVHR